MIPKSLLVSYNWETDELIYKVFTQDNPEEDVINKAWKEGKILTDSIDGKPITIAVIGNKESHQFFVKNKSHLKMEGIKKHK